MKGQIPPMIAQVEASTLRGIRQAEFYQTSGYIEACLTKVRKSKGSFISEMFNKKCH